VKKNSDCIDPDPPTLNGTNKLFVHVRNQNRKQNIKILTAEIPKKLICQGNLFDDTLSRNGK
jgi:hypothetical protein